MRDRDTRAAMLLLQKQGHGVRTIARALGVSRNTVRRVLASGEATVPELERSEQADGHEEQIRALHQQCKGNLVRVREKLAEVGVVLAYSTLTGFCRRHGIGVEPKTPVGQYHFAPGQEMQHDTSPHRVTVAGRETLWQCASLVLCYSRRQYAQAYPVWNRFWAKVFLTEALVWLGGAAGQCMLDNSSVLVASGNGKDAVMAPEMAAFGVRFGFVFAAHRLGDANRSARVERPFHYIENNFYPGRHFTDAADLNAQMRTWCVERDRLPKKTLGNACPLDLFVAEAPHLRPLPLHVPEPYRMHSRIVDESGYVHLHTNRYSVPTSLMEHTLSVLETKSQVRIFDGHSLVCEHEREPDHAARRVMLPAHKGDHERWRHHHMPPRERPEETAMRASSEPLRAMVDVLKKKHGGRATRMLQRLHRMWLDYPQEPMDLALTRALEHGLSDLGRIERLVLQHVAGDFFRLPTPDPEDEMP